MSSGIDDVFKQSHFDSNWQPIIEIIKCESCKKELFSTQLASIAEKWSVESSSCGFYGRYIYACKDCYDKSLEEFKKNMHKDGDLITVKWWDLLEKKNEDI